MNQQDKALLEIAVGLGADRFISSPVPVHAASPRIPSSPTSPGPQPARPPSPYSTATPSQLTASSTLDRMIKEEALPSQASVGSDYQWATLNTDVIIGGHTFPAGTKIVVSLSQTSTSGGGKAHTTSIVVKVWAKFGQTFDSSSWIEGKISAGSFTLTGQSASWSSQTGFGGPGRTPQPTTAHAATSSVAYSPPQQSFPVEGPQSAVPLNPMTQAPGGSPLTANQALIRAQREQVLFPDQSRMPSSDGSGSHYPHGPVGAQHKGGHGVGAGPHGGGGHHGGGGGHHGGGHHGGGFRRGGFRRGGFGPWWGGWSGTDVVVVQPESCSWMPPAAAVPPYVVSTLAKLPYQTLANGQQWRSAFVEAGAGYAGGWWGELSSPHSYFVCVVTDSVGLYGLGMEYTATPKPGDYHVNGNGVVLRASPLYKSNAIATLQNGEGVYVFGEVETDPAYVILKKDDSVVPNTPDGDVAGIDYVHVGTQTHGAGWIAMPYIEPGAGTKPGAQPSPSPSPAPMVQPEGMGLVSKVLLGGAIVATVAGGAFLVWKAVEAGGRRSAYA